MALIRPELLGLPDDFRKKSTRFAKWWGGSLWTPIMVVLATVAALVTTISQWSMHRVSHECEVVRAQFRAGVINAYAGDTCDIGAPNAPTLTIALAVMVLILVIVAVIPRSWATSWIARIVAITILLTSLGALITPNSIAV